MGDNSATNIKIFLSKDNKTYMESVENIVKMILSTEVDINFEFEFIKTQAVIARTQLVKAARIFGGPGCPKYKNCDICDEGHYFDIVDFPYLKEKWKEDYEKNMEKISKAVEETDGLIITLNNKPIDAKYHNTCGGSTENSEDVISNRVIYLRKVLCDYCRNSPNWEGYIEISIKEIEEKLNVKFPKHTPTINTEIKGYLERIERDEDGRVTSIRIAGKDFKGAELMNKLNLDSTRFSIAPTAIRFSTGGKGDGLGLCQYGGNQMALEGHSFEDIISYYYTGVKIKKFEKPCIKRPLSGRILVIDPGHGGDSQDLVGAQGLREKNIVLDIGNKLMEELKELGAVVYCTREKDEYLSLSKRSEIGNKVRPDFFISLHMNSFPNTAIHGCEIYYYRNDKDGEALGKSIMNSLVSNINLLDRGVKTADLFLLREIGASSLQLEIDYITNPERELKFGDEDFKSSVAKAIANGIGDYYRY